MPTFTSKILMVLSELQVASLKHDHESETFLIELRIRIRIWRSGFSRNRSTKF